MKTYAGALIFLNDLPALGKLECLMLNGGINRRGLWPALSPRTRTVGGVHELLANVTLALVIAHVAAVVFAGFAHRENLVRSMVTGYKRS